MSLFSDIITVQFRDRDSDRMIANQLALCVDVKNKTYEIADLTQYAKLHDGRLVFYFDMMKRDIISNIMEGKHKSDELRVSLLMHIKDNSKDVSNFCRFILAEYDTVFKPKGELYGNA